MKVLRCLLSVISMNSLDYNNYYNLLINLVKSARCLNLFELLWITHEISSISI